MKTSRQLKTKIVKQDGKLTEEADKLFKFSGMEPTPKHHGETDLEGGTAETDKELNSKIPIMKKNIKIQDKRNIKTKNKNLT